MSQSFQIIIVGGGLGGLAASIALSKKGHKVTILESTAQLQTIGGGIAVPPNSLQVIEQLGFLQRLRDAAGVSGAQATHFKRYTGEVLSSTPSKQPIVYGERMNIYRPNFQKVLVEIAKENGVTIEFNSRIIGINDSSGSPVAILKDGRRKEADLIVAADGAKSTIRGMMYPGIDLNSNYNCYRVTIDGSLLKADPDLKHLLKEGNVWWGPYRVVVGSPVQKGAYYSFELPHPGDTGTAGDWSKPGDVELMKRTYADFEPTVRKLLDLVDPGGLVVWKLVQLPTLDSWVWKSGKVVLVGDAAHAIMPYSGQGHAMAMEDGASLAECLSRCEDTTDIPKALHAFETIRKPRTNLLASFALMNSHIWQLPDGEEQQQRDERMKRHGMWPSQGWDGKHVDALPDSPKHPMFSAWMMAHDAIGFTKRRLDDIWDTL